MTQRTVRRTNARNRRAMDPSVPKKERPAVIATVDATAADTVQLTFESTVVPNKLPGFTAGAGGAETVSSMSKISETVVELVFSGDVQGTDMIVQGGDPGIRTAQGGFVPAGTYAVPAFP